MNLASVALFIRMASHRQLSMSHVAQSYQAPKLVVWADTGYSGDEGLVLGLG